MPIARPLDLGRLRARPLAERRSLTDALEILVPLDASLRPVAPSVEASAALAADRIRAARDRDAQVVLMYGAHLLRNGAALLVTDLMEKGWLTHLATNGAGTIHDWEFAWHGRSSESVEDNVATGTFGAWEETGRNIHLALMSGALRGEGYGVALGRYILEDGCDLPAPDILQSLATQFSGDPLASAASDLLWAHARFELVPGRNEVLHRWKQASILAQARRCGVPVTVHPGIGYDIIACHPMFNGSVVGRAAGMDFRLFGGAVDGLDGGVVLSVGSAIMAPQVFEKSLSCVHNLRFQDGRPPVSGHSIFVVDLQDGGNWDWSQGEPPKDSAAYYLRFCKSFSRMGGDMRYVQSDNLAFIQHLHARLVGR
ncbi:MAG: hypothetical protein ACKOEQ_05345 [Verrucomicrobiota bacterium]